MKGPAQELVLRVRTLLSSFRSQSMSGMLARAATGTLGLQIALTGMSLMANILLTRWLGVTRYGVYSYAMTWLGLLTIPAQLGLGQLFVRQLAAYRVQENWSELRGLLQYGLGLVLPFSILLGLATLGVVQILPNTPEGSGFVVLALVMMQLPFVVLMGLSGFAMRGLDYVVRGQVPSSLVQPFLFLVFLAVAIFVIEAEPSAVTTAQLALARTVIAFMLAIVLLFRILPDQVRAAESVYEPRLWMAVALPMLLISTLMAMTGRIDALVLGSLDGPEAVGIYNVVFRGVQLLSFGLLAINWSIGPTISKLFVTGDMRRLQKLMTRSARMILLYTVPISIVFIFIGEWFLGLFGPAFTAGTTALVILSVGRIFAATMGSPSLLLMMTGNERDVLKVLLVSISFNIVLDLLLVPRFGLNGAAIAGALHLIVFNGLLSVRAYRTTGISTTAVSRAKPV